MEVIFFLFRHKSIHFVTIHKVHFKQKHDYIDYFTYELKLRLHLIFFFTVFNIETFSIFWGNISIYHE